MSANPHNVLSVVIMFTAEHAESARVVYRDERLALDSTPFVGVTEGPDTIQALGLRPEMADTIVMGVDGNYIVSFRRLGQIMKIDATSGAVIWRIGGHKSDVTFPDDPFRGFSAQHSAAILPNGNLLLYDNGNQHEPPETRAADGQATVFYRLLRIASLYRVATP